MQPFQYPKVATKKDSGWNKKIWSEIKINTNCLLVIVSRFAFGVCFFSGKLTATFLFSGKFHHLYQKLSLGYEMNLLLSIRLSSALWHLNKRLASCGLDLRRLTILSATWQPQVRNTIVATHKNIIHVNKIGRFFVPATFIDFFYDSFGPFKTSTL